MKQGAGDRKPGARGDARRAGFTLVEMLVVVVIILLLMGVVFRMTRPVSEKQAEAETVARLERFKAAIEEFYAEYGQYPPVPYHDGQQYFMYEYPWKEGMRSDLTGLFEGMEWKDAPLFTFGLMSFLVPRYAGRAAKAHPSLLRYDQWRQYNDKEGDLERDVRACKRWEHFIGDLIISGEPIAHLLGGAKSRVYTNFYATALDGWNREFVYVSPPPHQSYLLFSRGPDGNYDTSNPGRRDIKANKDNIYGDVGFAQP